MGTSAAALSTETVVCLYCPASNWGIENRMEENSGREACAGTSEEGLFKRKERADRAPPRRGPAGPGSLGTASHSQRRAPVTSGKKGRDGKAASARADWRGPHMEKSDVTSMLPGLGPLSPFHRLGVTSHNYKTPKELWSGPQGERPRCFSWLCSTP